MNKAPQSQCTLHTYSQKTQSKRNLSRISVTRSFLLEQSGQAHFSSPVLSILRGAVPLCAPSQHRLAVYYLIVACASIAERLCNRKGLSRISVTRSFLLHKKNLAQRDKPFPMIAPRISSGFNPAAYHLCTAAYFCSQL